MPTASRFDAAAADMKRNPSLIELAGTLNPQPAAATTLSLQGKTIDRVGTEPLFRTITSDDWKRSLAAARTTPNSVAEQIRLSVPRSKISL